MSELRESLQLEALLEDERINLFKEDGSSDAPDKRGFFSWRGKKRGIRQAKTKKAGHSKNTVRVKPGQSVSGSSTVRGKARAKKLLEKPGVPVHVTTLEHHKAPVLFAEVLVPHAIVVTLDQSGLLCVWNTETRSLTKEVALKVKPTALAWIADRLLVGCAEAMLLLDEHCTLIHDIPIPAFSFTADREENVIWVGSDSIVLRMQLSAEDDPKEVGRVDLTRPQPVDSLVTVVGRDGKFELWVVQGEEIEVVDAENYGLLVDLAGFAECAILGLEWGGDENPSTLWMALEDGAIVRWDAPARQMAVSVEVHEGKCFAVRRVGDYLWTCGEDEQVHIYEPQKMKEVAEISEFNEGAVRDVAIVHDGEDVTAWSISADNTVCVWLVTSSFPNPAKLEELASPRGAAMFRVAGGIELPGAVGLEKSSDDSQEEDSSAKRDASSADAGTEHSSEAQHNSNATDADDTEASAFEGKTGAASPPRSPRTKSPRTRRKKGSRSNGPIHEAALANNPEGIQSLLQLEMQRYQSRSDATKRKAQAKFLDKRTHRKRTALHLAALSDSVDSVRKLVELGASLNARDKYGLFAVHLGKTQEIKDVLVQAMQAQGLDAELDTPVPNHALRIGVRAKRRGKAAGDADGAPLSPKQQQEEDGGDASNSNATPFSPEQQSAVVTVQSLIRRKQAKREFAQRKKRSEKRRNIAGEMLKTETTYVEGLDKIINHIYKELNTKAWRTAADVEEKDLKVIFPASLSMLYTAHVGWLAQLKAVVDSWSSSSTVGDLFLKLSPYLKMYIVYVSNFELAVLKIRELKKKPKSKFGDMVREVFNKMGDPTNDLNSLLVTPVQRIPRYVMLLADLLKNTAEEHPDRENLKEASRIMKETTVLVDKKAEDAKNALKVLEVSESILSSPKPIVQPNRKWVRDGPLQLVVGHSSTKPRYVFLFTDIFIVCKEVEQKKKEAAKPPRYRYVKEMALLAATVQSIADNEKSKLQHGFIVKSPKLAFIFAADSEKEKRSWIHDIAGVADLQKRTNRRLITAQTMRGHVARHSSLPKGGAAAAAAANSGAHSSPTSTPPPTTAPPPAPVGTGTAAAAAAAEEGEKAKPPPLRKAVSVLPAAATQQQRALSAELRRVISNTSAGDIAVTPKAAASHDAANDNNEEEEQAAAEPEAGDEDADNVEANNGEQEQEDGAAAVGEEQQEGEEGEGEGGEDEAATNAEGEAGNAEEAQEAGEEASAQAEIEEHVEVDDDGTTVVVL